MSQQYVTKDSGERQQYDSGMQRDLTEGKTRWHLITRGPMLKRWAELMTRGAEKYDDDNWMKADSDVELNRFAESAFRHFMQWYNGDNDEDHAAAVIFNINGWEYTSEKLDDEPIIDPENTPYEAGYAKGWNDRFKKELPFAAKDWSWMASVERYKRAKTMMDDGATVAEIQEMYNA